MLALFGAAGCVLLIASLNLVGLLLARHLLRQGEFAVRTALGTTRGRLERQVSVEVLLLTLLGSELGIALASTGLSWSWRSAGPIRGW